MPTGGTVCCTRYYASGTRKIIHAVVGTGNHNLGLTGFILHSLYPQSSTCAYMSASTRNGCLIVQSATTSLSVHVSDQFALTDLSPNPSRCGLPNTLHGPSSSLTILETLVQIQILTFGHACIAQRQLSVKLLMTSLISAQSVAHKLVKKSCTGAFEHCEASAMDMYKPFSKHVALGTKFASFSGTPMQPLGIQRLYPFSSSVFQTSPSSTWRNA